VPVASFTYAPAQPFTSQTITFTSTSQMANNISWDLDGDGACDDATGTTATTSFEVAGQHSVTVCASDGIIPMPATQTQIVNVHNRPPTATFTYVPSNPVAGENVVLTSTAFDPDGPIASQTWDLDGDGAFDDGTGELVNHAFPRKGTYPLALRVVDRDGAVTIGRATVVVARKPFDNFPFDPLVHVISSPTSTGAHIDLLTVKAPKGAKVNVRCKGRGCPYKSKSTKSKGKRIDVRKARRNYRAGAVIEIRVTKTNTIGKFVRITIRDGKSPKRVDRCLTPGKSKPVAC
jgi:hypothetical protein